jgi:ribonucleoside-diphosphate reductase beta chain
MSKEQYNLKTKTDYLGRKMFLDPAGPVTIQRFEEVKYPKIQKIEQTARGFFWVPEEISLTKDKMDHKDSSDTIKHIFTSNLLRQTALDSIQGRAPNQVFSPVISIPELEALVGNWSFFETNIHSKSYSHIIRNVYGVPKEEFNKIHDTKEIIEKEPLIEWSNQNKTVRLYSATNIETLDGLVPEYEMTFKFHRPIKKVVDKKNIIL